MYKAMSVLDQVVRVFTTIYGWFVLGLTTAVSLIESEKLAFGMVFFAIVFDLAWGIASAIKRKKFILSEAARETVKKVLIYASTLFLVLIIERTIHENSFVGFRVVCAIAAACELISVTAHMLIIKPNMPFVRIFTLSLKGEMKKKLNVDVSDAFKDDSEPKKQSDERVD